MFALLPWAEISRSMAENYKGPYKSGLALPPIHNQFG